MAETLEHKTERNKRVQARYDELMGEGKHGHYETMFRVVREEVERELASSGTEANDEQAFINAVRAGCNAADMHLACSYPNCGCKQFPRGVRGALSAHIAQTTGDRGNG